MLKFTLIRGDGIGPEVAEAAMSVLRATGLQFEVEEKAAGEIALKECGDPIPEDVMESARRNGLVLKGPITTPVGGGFRSVNVELRTRLDLYANVRPVRSFRGVRAKFTGVDLVIIRENTEDLYVGIEHRVGDDAAEAIKVITKKASRRIAEFAFRYAVQNGRRKVTAVHKANILKLTDGLFLECCREVGKLYPEIQFEGVIVDNLALQLVKNPEHYEVIVAPNLYGDILSDLCAGLVGGLGLAAGANVGDEYAMFEPVHGSAPKHAGKNEANPAAMIMATSMMLAHAGFPAEAKRIAMAVEDVISEGRWVTYDLGGSASTTEMAKAIADKVNASLEGT